MMLVTMAISRKAFTILGFVLCLALVACEAQRGGVPRRGPVAPIGEKLFNVLQFGAKPGSRQPSTQAFISAWRAACNSMGSARLLIPAGVYKLGETLFEGPCKCQTITVQLIGTLQALSDVSEYTGKGWISFDSVSGLVLTGGGTIDGQGQLVWKYNDCQNNANCIHLPASLYMNNLKDAKLIGIKSVNSMGFHMHITNCYLFRAQRVHITSPADSPNTDGMHISKSTTVKVMRSVISTGDDCISVGQGVTNVTISKVTCGPGHGISVGSLGKYPHELDVTGVIVKNCTLTGTTNGLRIKTYPASDPSRASGMLFDNIIMNNVQNPIIIDQHYGSKSSKPSLVKISDVIYQNIRGTTLTPIAVNLECSTGAPCQNIHFANINLKHSQNMKLTSTCANARVGYMGLQYPPPCR